jgi:hypothetical protein
MLLALIALTVATVIAYSYLSAQSTSVGIARNIGNHAKARYIAETGLELAIAYVISGADWRTEKVNGTWVSNQAFAGGTYTIVGQDGEDLDGDGSITLPAEGDGDLTDDTFDPLTLTVTASANGATHVARVTLTVTEDPLLVNGGFEESLSDGNDNPDPGWDGEDGGKLAVVDSSTGQVYEGNYALWSNPTNPGNGYILDQQITGLTEGETYTLTAYLHMLAIEGLNKHSNPMFDLSISETHGGADLALHSQTTLTADWQEVTLNATAPASGELWIQAHFEDVKSASIYLDAMTLEGPEGEGSSVSYVVDW